MRALTARSETEETLLVKDGVRHIRLTTGTRYNRLWDAVWRLLAAAVK